MRKKDELIFGIHPVSEAIQAGRSFNKIFLKKGLAGDNFHALFHLIRKHQIPYQFVPLEKLNNISRKNHQGVIGEISAIEFWDIENLVFQLFEDGKVPFLLILDSITDVRNFGAIVRTAECAGVDAILVPNQGSARIGADAQKSSAGALNLMKICRTESIAKSLSYLKDAGLSIAAATEKGEKSFDEADFTNPLGIIMGSEEKGIASNNLKYVDQQVSVPLYGQINSLNVSVAAAIIMYEVVRQRKK